MKKAGTSKPLMTIIRKAMHAWLQEGILEIEWTFPEDEGHDGSTQTLAEQQPNACAILRVVCGVEFGLLLPSDSDGVETRLLGSCFFPAMF